MNIYAKKGDKVACVTFNGGRPPHRKTVKKYLTKGGIYTIERTAPHGFHTEVYLQEFPEVAFNSVFFEDYPEEQK